MGVLHASLLETPLTESWHWLGPSTCDPLYADDLHVGVAFYSKQELGQRLKNFGIVIDLLAELGLQVNVDKSQILFAVAGANSQKLQKETVVHRRDGSWINLPRQNGATAFKVDSVATYLGVKMNYRNMESQTLQCRLQAGNHAACRLHRWLTGRQIDCKHRLRLWNSCVFPVLTYGLFTTGITYTGLHKLQSMMFQSLRNTLRDYAYLTRHTRQEALAQHQCPEPLQILLQAVRALRRSVTQRLPLLPEHDIVHSTNWSPLEQAERLIWTELHQGPQVPISVNPLEAPCTKQMFHCPRCTFQTDNMANLRRHCTHIHNDTQFRSCNLDWRQHAVMGLPQCRFCFATFTTWRSFRSHIERRVCQESHSLAATTSLTALQPILRPCVNFLNLWHFLTLGQEILNFCYNTRWQMMITMYFVPDCKFVILLTCTPLHSVILFLTLCALWIGLSFNNILRPVPAWRIIASFVVYMWDVARVCLHTWNCTTVTWCPMSLPRGRNSPRCMPQPHLAATAIAGSRLDTFVPCWCRPLSFWSMGVALIL